MEVKDLYNENYKTLPKKLKKTQVEKYPMFIYYKAWY